MWIPGGQNMKRITASAAAAVMLSGMCCLNAAAAENSAFTQDQINSSDVKPILSMSEIDIPADKLSENRTVNISLSVSGASKKYSTAEVWTIFDDRLVINRAADGKPAAVKGPAAKYLNTAFGITDYYNKQERRLIKQNGVRFIAACGNDYGLDGVLYTVQVTLPENAAAGDVYPLDIVYMDSDITGNPYVFSSFTNISNSEDGQLMEAWTFQNGLHSGYIRIVDDVPPSTVLGDANLDGKVTVADSVAILQHIANKDKFGLTSQALENADVYNRGDGISARDALTIQKLDAGVISSLPESSE